MSNDDFNMQETLDRREAVMQRIIAHVRTDTKEKAIALLAGWMSIDELEHIAQFWDERLSPEELKKLIATKDTLEKLNDRVEEQDEQIASLQAKVHLCTRYDQLVAVYEAAEYQLKMLDGIDSTAKYIGLIKAIAAVEDE